MDKYLSPPEYWLQYKKTHVESKYLQWIQLLSYVGVITYGFLFAIYILMPSLLFQTNDRSGDCNM